MKEKEFKKGISLLEDYSIPELRQNKSNLIETASVFTNERNVLSAQTIQTLHNRRRSVQSKRTRIEYIDEKLLPEQVLVYRKPLGKEFSDVKAASMLRIRALLKEKERLSKVTNEHNLKSKMSLRALSFAYKELNQVNNYLVGVDTAEVLFAFFRDQKINYYNLTDVENRKIYNDYIKSQRS